ncbi:hypothetical protein C2S52_018534 [Perilla frutescens var. hirtella]|uniref:Uncharacterized protein n=1 Tax=Perilla frutescens var. hirtella TaxID=608512 RepID=A0AAD4IM63_PERFH|nr:hypothetical protein C2S53_018358 [Perilla frutescens var. hirtella]KAH6767551.1 hypothetical protein C2S52_018534 [Perilla frutescens var. hirtella]KAH6812229.1 hypothetical protein C2S51_025991 [Perilla frutescens var. frutescens]
MRCKKHPADQSCSVGVCASCLRERLVAVIAVQAQAQALKQALQDCRKSDSQLPQPLSFPRSVSPYISRRKSDTAAATWRPLFYSTPQVGPNASFTVEIKSNKKSRFSSLFRGLFRSKTDNKPDFDVDPVSDPTVSINSCSASPAWFPSIISGRRKKKVSTFSIDESAIRTGRNRGRGMSPVRNADHEDEHCHGGSSGNSSDSQGWRQTPRRTPASTRRGGGGGKAAAHSKSLSGLTFCLSPLLRPSPNHHWNQKVAPPEAAVAGDPRATPKPYLSTAASFCKNRSRKLADFGRFPYDPTY